MQLRPTGIVGTPGVLTRGVWLLPFGGVPFEKFPSKFCSIASIPPFLPTRRSRSSIESAVSLAIANNEDSSVSDSGIAGRPPFHLPEGPRLVRPPDTAGLIDRLPGSLESLWAFLAKRSREQIVFGYCAAVQ